MKHLFKSLALAATIVCSLASCTPSATTAEDEDRPLASGLDPEMFASITPTDTTALITLVNDKGMEVSISNYGARIVTLMVPDRAGQLVDVALGADSLGAYKNTPLSPFGAIMGRYAGNYTNRPAKANGWMNRIFKIANVAPNSLTLTLQSDSIADGLPGNIATQITYTLTDDNQLDIVISAIADKATPVDIAPALYLNLNGVADSTLTSIKEHTIKSPAKQYLVRDSLGNYNGDMLMGIWTSMDIEKEKSLNKFIYADNQQVKYAGGLDTYFVMPKYGYEMEEMLTLYSPQTGIELTMSGSYPGFEINTTNSFDGSIKGKYRASYPKRSAVAIMPHKYPDAPNKPGWGLDQPLRPGEVMHEKIVLKFSVR